MTDHLTPDPDDLALLVRVIRAAVTWGYEGGLSDQRRRLNELADSIEALPLDLAVKFGRPVVVLDE